MPVVLEKREAGRKWTSAGTVADDWAECAFYKVLAGCVPAKFDSRLALYNDGETPTLSVNTWQSRFCPENPVRSAMAVTERRVFARRRFASSMRRSSRACRRDFPSI